MNERLPMTYQHAKLMQLAKRLARMHMADKQMLWLATALLRISLGEDANLELGVKRRKGQDQKKYYRHLQNQIAIHWIAGRMNPIDGSPPPTKSVAISEAAMAFDLDEDNLKRACPGEAELKTMAVFDWDSQLPKIN